MLRCFINSSNSVCFDSPVTIKMIEDSVQNFVSVGRVELIAIQFKDTVPFFKQLLIWFFFSFLCFFIIFISFTLFLYTFTFFIFNLLLFYFDFVNFRT